MLDNKLIESALALTGKTMEDMEEIKWSYTLSEDNKTIECTDDQNLYEEFSIEKFCYYLLSPEFIEKYWRRYTDYPRYESTDILVSEQFWKALYLYQSGNEKPLIELLSKIWN